MIEFNKNRIPKSECPKKFEIQNPNPESELTRCGTWGFFRISAFGFNNHCA
jgi:hypothetical protein